MVLPVVALGNASLDLPCSTDKISWLDMYTIFFFKPESAPDEFTDVDKLGAWSHALQLTLRKLALYMYWR